MRTAILLLCVMLEGCTVAQPDVGGRPGTSPGPSFGSWVYQLQGYPQGGLAAIATSGADLAVIDLARDAASDYFTRAEIDRLHQQGMIVLAYFEIGSIEDFRPEYAVVEQQAPDLLLNPWLEWPGETFVRYWDSRWWDLVIKGRIDKAVAAGFDGVYLDTPLAYEAIDLALVPGETRATLAARMVDLIAKISAYGKGGVRDFLIVPQNSPELGYARFDDPSSGTNSSYLSAVDGIGMEELYYLATDTPCDRSWCSENLAATRMLEASGKFVLSVDYAVQPAHVQDACARAQAEHFTEYVTTVALDRLAPLCP